jgi:hypothetical protein
MNVMVTTILKTAETWKGIIDFISPYEMNIDTNGNLAHALHTGTGYFENCQMNGTVTPISNTSLYNVSVTLANTCTDVSLNGTSYTGLATSQNAADTILVFAVASNGGSISVSADFYQ